MQQSVCYFLVVVLTSLTASTNAIRCFEGRSDLETSPNFFASDCGAGAQYCFYSLDRAMNTQAVCHSSTTPAEFLQVCQSRTGCMMSPQGVVVCCCSGDYCNFHAQRAPVFRRPSRVQMKQAYYDGKFNPNGYNAYYNNYYRY
ncbi:hypothetical protein WR25_10074 [Diploscapter pachys]|uniref:Activin types I and II receptor domain-containing protein n=1 Tax=Diploscapter pachys TaxID=2018661 RepID=A0A2A2JAZ9_9BILA|nr:hypothetical protein WR25_10074 [Diploscapter pachys]